MHTLSNRGTAVSANEILLVETERDPARVNVSRRSDTGVLWCWRTAPVAGLVVAISFAVSRRPAHVVYRGASVPPRGPGSADCAGQHARRGRGARPGHIGELDAQRAGAPAGRVPHRSLGQRAADSG